MNRRNIARQVNSELLVPTGILAGSFVSMNRRCRNGRITVNKPWRSFPRYWLRSLEKDSPGQICKIWGSSIWHMKNARHCLANWAGHTTASCYLSPIQTSEDFMKRNPSMPTGLHGKGQCHSGVCTGRPVQQHFCIPVCAIYAQQGTAGHSGWECHWEVA